MDAGQFEIMTEPSSVPNTFPWPPILLGLAIAGAVGAGWLMPIEWPGLGDTPARVIGVGIGLGGLVLFVWGVVNLTMAGTTVLPDVASTVLVTWGAFRRFRNPLYLGEVMMLLGVAELTRNIWFVIFAGLFAIAVTYLAILPEERHLEETFGDAYRDYKERSRRWI